MDILMKKLRNEEYWNRKVEGWIIMMTFKNMKFLDLIFFILSLWTKFGKINTQEYLEI